MEHKLIIAQNLREGLATIKRMYREAFYRESLFKEQWQWLLMRENFDLEMKAHHRLIDSHFAWKSQKLLQRIQGD